MTQFEVMIPGQQTIVIEAEDFQLTQSGNIIYFQDGTNKAIAAIATIPGLIIRKRTSEL